MIKNNYYFKIITINKKKTNPPLKKKPIKPQKKIKTPNIPKNPLNINNITKSSTALT